MLLVTWNVNSLRARLTRVLELLQEHRPDVVCLQETKVDRGAFPYDELGAAGYSGADHSAGRWAGVAILCRGAEPPEDVSAGLPDESVPTEARWIEATVAGVRVASAYVPNGRAVDSPSFAEKLRFLEAAADRAAALRGRPLVLAGDLNVTRSDADVYDPAAFIGSTHVTLEERERFDRLLEQGLVDAFRELHPHDQGYTWWDYRQGHFHRRMGLRIDFALLSRELAAKLVSCGIDRTYRKGPKPSDHAPLLVRLAD